MEYVKRENNVITWWKKILLLMNVHVLWVLKLKKKKKKKKKKLLSVCLHVCTYVRPFCPHLSCPQNLSARTITFERVSASKQNLVLLCIKCSSGIDMWSKILTLILILNRIWIMTKTLWYATEFGGYLKYLEHKFLLINFMLKSWKKICANSLRLSTVLFHHVNRNWMGKWGRTSLITT